MSQQDARGAGKPGKLAIFTMVRNEGQMLDRWVEHYAGQAGGYEHLRVIDDGSDDGSTSDLQCEVRKVPDDFDRRHWNTSRMKLVNEVGAELLKTYDAVCFTDADEFLVPNPSKYERLLDFLDDRPETDAFAAVALNVTHHVATEAPLDLSLPILDQRKYAKFVALMSKPAIKRVNVPWKATSHGLGAPYAIEPDLVNFHLKFADRDMLAAAAAARFKVFEADHTADKSSWSATDDELVAMLDEINADVPDVAKVPKFRMPRDRLKAIVVNSRPGEWRSYGGRQMEAMKKRPLVRIPRRFVGTL